MPLTPPSRDREVTLTMSLDERQRLLNALSAADISLAHTWQTPEDKLAWEALLELKLHLEEGI